MQRLVFVLLIAMARWQAPSGARPHEVAHGLIRRAIFFRCGDNAGYVKIPSSVSLVRRIPIGVTRIVITRNGFKRARSSVCKPKPDSNISSNIPYRISLHLTQRSTCVRRAGDAHGGAVVLRMALGAVPTQEQSPQIRHSSAKQREQFRVS